MVTHHESPPSSEVPRVEHWQGPELDQHSSIVRLDIAEDLEFARLDNKSGFRRALNYLSWQADISLKGSVRTESWPFIICRRPNNVVQFYETLGGSRGRYYGLLRTDSDEYELKASSQLSKSVTVELPAGSDVHFGLASDGAAKAHGGLESPNHELYRRVATAAWQGVRPPANRLVGRLRSGLGSVGLK